MTVTTAGSAAAVPPRAPCEMPTQSLRQGRAARRSWPDWRTVVARIVAFGGAFALTGFAAAQMSLAVSVGATSWLQWSLVALFTLSFGWIAWSAASAIAGLAVRTQPGSGGPLLSKTALVMPVYNEAPDATAAAVLAMAEGLSALGHGEDFEFFIISDTNDPDVWVRETAAYQRLVERLGDRMPVWYRRRARNTGRKAGNVAEFVENWGGRYDAMLLLDADSLLAPETIVTLSRCMAADPELGILQTIPMLAGGRGLLARMQQFASRVYGPVVGRGVTAWQGDDGNYWGHNAILRTSAFAAHCGLPTLPGRPPFGGAILSHDFVEAALIRRGGHKVRMMPALEGSWEDSPPTLLDVATRDRRWAQGNLQHAAVVTARGLAWPSRVHLINGILGYLMSPAWCALIVVGVVLSVQARWSAPVYFSEPFQLFPDWPRFDTARMIWLFVLAMGVLVLPKLIGIARALRDPRVRAGCGGAKGLFRSAGAELLISSCYAPILVMMQTRQVWQILRGRDSGWGVQRRVGAGNPWREVLARHSGHTIAGVLLLVLLSWASPQLLLWMAPTMVGLLLAIPLSKASGSPRLGDRIRARGLFATPEETAPPAIFVARDQAQRDFERAIAGLDRTSPLSDPQLRARHLAVVYVDPGRRHRGAPDVPALTARQKLAEAQSDDEVFAWFDQREWMALLSSAEMLGRLDALRAAGQGG